MVSREVTKSSASTRYAVASNPATLIESFKRSLCGPPGYRRTMSLFTSEISGMAGLRITRCTWLLAVAKPNTEAVPAFTVTSTCLLSALPVTFTVRWFV